MSIHELGNIIKDADTSKNAVEKLVGYGFEQQSAMVLAYTFQTIAEGGDGRYGLRDEFKVKVEGYAKKSSGFKQELANFSQKIASL